MNSTNGDVKVQVRAPPRVVLQALVTIFQQPRVLPSLLLMCHLAAIPVLQ